ncbi:cation:H+ antiporter [Natranaerovirga pectinivora]|uniref:Cation:H+ antiporter n=1 Tax=Natranaerovirga pectinivora TaxID=682400 RepID=A0A4R3MNK1_9FIRM|nr:calcium/sodium antiporter [Natranaerovirga pectinivora]TCT16082.1 cation:H+ antiporter [Natranaerovirga pectinivora]
MDQIIFTYLSAVPTLVLVFIIAISLYLLSKGADLLVDQAVNLSLYWGIPKIIIGATIISLGTTLPEVTVSVLSAIKGNPDMALGNAIGSIITNTGLIIGLASFVGRLPVNRVLVRRQGNIQVLTGILLTVVSVLALFFSSGNIGQWIGWVFLILLIVYIHISIKWAKEPSKKDIAKFTQLASTMEESAVAEEVISVSKSFVGLKLLKLIGGMALVIGASQILIPAVEISAIRIGIPQSVIAATLIAFGTSLPEVVTGIKSVKKGHGEIAIGNIIGANILNILFVVGGAAAVTSGGLDVPFNFFRLQIPIMVFILVVFQILLLRKKEEIDKKKGSLLLVIYLAYIILNYIQI